MLDREDVVEVRNARRESNEEYLGLITNVGGFTQDTRRSSSLRSSRIGVIDTDVKTNNVQTFMTLMKAFVGPAHLYLAKALADGGVVLGIVLLFFCCALNAYCVTLLVDVKRVVNVDGYAEIGEACFGRRMKNAVNLALLSSQLGIVAMYFIFSAQTMRDAIAQLADCASWATGLSEFTLIACQLVLQMPLALLRDMRSISFFAIAADILILTGMAYTIGENTHAAAQGTGVSITFAEKNIALFFGTAVLIFEGIGLMMPIQEAMADPTYFKHLVATSMFLCCGIYSFLAITGYLARGGQDVQTNLLLAMPEDQKFAQVAKILYSLAVQLTFPLQAFPGYQILELWFKVPEKATWKRNGLRCATVVILALLAYAGKDNLSSFVSLLGGITMCPLAFVFPALFHYKVVAATKGQRYLDASIAIFGTCCIFLVSTVTVIDWISGSGDSFTTCDNTPSERAPAALWSPSYAHTPVENPGF